jgi:hypothetical protein
MGGVIAPTELLFEKKFFLSGRLEAASVWSECTGREEARKNFPIAKTWRR